MKVTLENPVSYSANVELPISKVAALPNTMSIDQLQSLAKKHSTIGNFFEFSKATIEILYRLATSIIYIPLSCLLWFYHQILNYNRDKSSHFVEPFHRIYEKLPKISAEKNKEYEEMVNVYFPPSNNNSWRSIVFMPTPLSIEYSRKAALNFVQTLDIFLDSFNKEVKKLKIPSECLKMSVMGFAYSPNVNRKEFLQACLKSNIEKLQDHIKSSYTIYSSSYSYSYDSRDPKIYGECIGYVPSIFGQVDSWSLTTNIANGDSGYYIWHNLYKSYHWTTNNAEARLKKFEKGLKKHDSA